jgi:glycosyltransferase involved in cell wall biosynthesis
VSALHSDRLRPSAQLGLRSGSKAHEICSSARSSSRSLQIEVLPRSARSGELCLYPVGVIIPAFNEEAGIGYVIEQLKQVARTNDLSLEILVVDDGSTDKTATVAESAGASVVQHRTRRGYGAALNTGVAEIRAETLVITDADGTYPAHSLPALLSALDDADMAVALRPRFSANSTLLRSIIKIPLIWLSNYIAGVRIPDLNSGMRAFRRKTVLPYLGILPNAFSWTTTITLSLLCDKFSIRYVPITYCRRIGKSKFGVKHAASLPWLLLRIALLFAPFKVFTPVVAIFLLYGAAQSTSDLIAARWVSPTALLAFTISGLLAIIAALAELHSTSFRNISRRLSTLDSSALGCDPWIATPGQHTPQTKSEHSREPASR